MAKNKLCITCRFFDDYFTRKCENSKSLNYDTVMEPQCVCKDWKSMKAETDKERKQ